MALVNAPTNRESGGRGLALGLLVLGLTLLLTVAAVLYLAGESAPAAIPTGEPVVTTDHPEPRPTPYWRFRDEWLTPHPKS